MADTSIEWADKVWNFLVGCTRTSADTDRPSGCDNCYAIREVARERCEQHKGLTKIRPASSSRPGPDWNGNVRFVEHKLEEPLHWRKPQRIFVNSVSDLFHAQVPWSVIDRAFAIMMASPQHTFLVLTKRDMRPWFEGAEERVRAAAERLANDKQWCHAHDDRPWPLSNVHLGISAEHQAAFDLRAPWLYECPAAVHWVSYEPALGEIDFMFDIRGKDRPHIEWVVVGGESGARARAFQVKWARSTIAQCREANVPCFVKQLGAHPMTELDGFGRRITLPDGTPHPPVRMLLADRKGAEMADWPADLQVQQLPTTRTE